MKLRSYALAVSLAAAGLGLALWQEHRTSTELAAQVTRLSRRNAALRYEANQSARRADSLGQRAVELDTQLGSAKTRTTATEVRQAQFTRELTAREEREVALMAELAALRQIAATRPDPGVTSVTGASSAQRRIGELEQQLVQLLARTLAESPATALTGAEDASDPPAPYQVVRVGPGNAFVVLDFGAGHGARPGQILGLWHGTSQVARVQISDARPCFSLAQVLSATLKGQLQTGDLALLTN